ncbi:hypothetical protein N781_16350 [Pontibacillus halophilus JSM 076056 = DSM 19796]|uniref:Uncharacterized protein n=1 Tax=Pontibacillus halophilus JSM 076056 = DSM 19796 TaxID=1385510 RepID=A0A0A5GMD7_9BACI|nr:hypothetical protein [Pontibacillus halophilus]KGX92330.1 hypothetical protein N781_16350 [Pontibacillus halophilus JSM 076056 = DSM 19796]
MEVWLMSIFSSIIVVMTVYNIIRVLNIAYKRKELTLRKFVLYSTVSIAIGVSVTSVLPFGYQKVVQYLL